MGSFQKRDYGVGKLRDVEKMKRYNAPRYKLNVFGLPKHRPLPLWERVRVGAGRENVMPSP